MDKIGGFLEGVLVSKNINKQVKSAKVVDCFKDVSREVFGSEVMKFLNVISFKGGLLKLSAANSIINYEVQIKKISLLEEINKVSEEEVTDVYCCVGSYGDL